MNLTIILVIIIFVYTLYYLIEINDYASVVSTIDGNTYRVKRNGNEQQSANSLAIINQRLKYLIGQIKQMKPRPEYADRLNIEGINENIMSGPDTSYTINKKQMFFCLSPKQSNENYNINILMYVALHELAHVASKSIGHTEEFKEIFKQLLTFSSQLKIYDIVDYSKKPTEYCGIQISS